MVPFDVWAFTTLSGGRWPSLESIPSSVSEAHPFSASGQTTACVLTWQVAEGRPFWRGVGSRVAFSFLHQASLLLQCTVSLIGIAMCFVFCSVERLTTLSIGWTFLIWNCELGVVRPALLAPRRLRQKDWEVSLSYIIRFYLKINDTDLTLSQDKWHWPHTVSRQMTLVFAPPPLAPVSHSK